MATAAFTTHRTIAQFSDNRRVILRGYGASLIALALLVVYYWSVPYRLVSTEFLDASNAVMPLYFVIVTGYLGYRTARKVNSAIWTPLVWFPVQSAIFYGFGPLVEIYGNEITQSLMSKHYLSITSKQLFRAHKLSVTGITCVLLGIYVHVLFRGKAWNLHTNQLQVPLFNPYRLGMFFVIAGGLFKYLIYKPSQWELNNLLVPGVLSAVADVSNLGFAIVAYCAASGNRAARTVMLTLFPLHIFLNMLSMSKMEVLIAILLPVIGAFTAHHNIRRVAIQLALIGTIFMLLQPYVHYGRSQIYERSGTITNAGYVERAGYLFEYLSVFGREEVQYYEEEDERQGWWTRLNFAGPQGQAMELFDSGFANPQLQDAWIRFIPRAIWPEKPILHGPGLVLYRLLSNNDDGASFLGLSIYGDFYWQFGWTGVFVGCFAFGWFLAILTAKSLQLLHRQEFIMMPFVLLGLKIGLLNPNKFIINTIGAVPIIGFYFLAISLVVWAMRGQRAAPHTTEEVSLGTLTIDRNERNGI